MLESSPATDFVLLVACLCLPLQWDLFWEVLIVFCSLATLETQQSVMHHLAPSQVAKQPCQSDLHHAFSCKPENLPHFLLVHAIANL